MPDDVHCFITASGATIFPNDVIYSLSLSVSSRWCVNTSISYAGARTTVHLCLVIGGTHVREHEAVYSQNV
jgi:hypothetical protein